MPWPQNEGPGFRGAGLPSRQGRRPLRLLTARRVADLRVERLSFAAGQCRLVGAHPHGLAGCGGVSRRLSIPRDTWVNIPGHGQSKINAAYAYGGPALAIKTIEAFTGITIDHVVIEDVE